jgi:hypothetical protein
MSDVADGPETNTTGRPSAAASRSAAIARGRPDRAWSSSPASADPP